MQVPEIELEFRNGEIKKILPDKKMKIEVLTLRLFPSVYVQMYMFTRILE